MRGHGDIGFLLGIRSDAYKRGDIFRHTGRLCSSSLSDDSPELMLPYLRTLSLVGDFSPGAIVREIFGMDIGLTVGGFLKSDSKVDGNKLLREGK